MHIKIFTLNGSVSQDKIWNIVWKVKFWENGGNHRTKTKHLSRNSRIYSCRFPYLGLHRKAPGNASQEGGPTLLSVGGRVRIQTSGRSGGDELGERQRRCAEVLVGTVVGIGSNAFGLEDGLLLFSHWMMGCFSARVVCCFSFSVSSARLCIALLSLGAVALVIGSKWDF